MLTHCSVLESTALVVGAADDPIPITGIATNDNPLSGLQFFLPVAFRFKFRVPTELNSWA